MHYYSLLLENIVAIITRILCQESFVNELFECPIHELPFINVREFLLYNESCQEFFCHELFPNSRIALLFVKC
jgi:hypothetical protein